MVKTIYFAHPMEGLQIPEESVQRALEARKLLGDDFYVWVPEEHQVSNEEQQAVDLATLNKADILLADSYKRGLDRNGKIVFGYGTAQEIGITKGLNHARVKQVPIIQVIRQHNIDNYHPFDIEGDLKKFEVSKNCHSLKGACDYIKENYSEKA